MKVKHVVIVTAVVASVGLIALKPISYPPGTLPDYPGAINHTLTDPATTICNKNWSTSSIRPPTSYTNPLKAKRLAEFNAKYHTTYVMADGELDHILSLTDLGDPTDPQNLDFEPYNIPYGAHQKDRLEVIINKKICNGEITLKQGQSMLTGDWVKYYNLYVTGKFGGILNQSDEDDI